MGSFFYGLLVIIVNFFIFAAIGGIINEILIKIKIRYFILLAMYLLIIWINKIWVFKFYIYIIPIILILCAIETFLLFFYNKNLLTKRDSQKFYLSFFAGFILMLYINYWQILSQYLPGWYIINPMENKKAFYVLIIILFVTPSYTSINIISFYIKILFKIKSLIHISMSEFYKNINISDIDEDDKDFTYEFLKSVIEHFIIKDKIQFLEINGKDYFFSTRYCKELHELIDKTIYNNKQISTDDVYHDIYLNWIENFPELCMNINLHIFGYIKIPYYYSIFTKTELIDFILDYNSDISFYEIDDQGYYTYNNI